MTKAYFKQSAPFVITMPNGGIVEEHFGRVVTKDEEISIARVVAPPEWSEPYQCPEFDEYTLMVRGKKRVEFDEKIIELTAGEAIIVPKGTRVRYSNPFSEEAEYWTICIPAFALEAAHREA
jgi:mannose-6-phosphate isomerase-like protein (cupin superfamily)